MKAPLNIVTRGAFRMFWLKRRIHLVFIALKQETEACIEHSKQ